eukprot:CAMPEP_0117643790 /NCGR_PEP_ID=MMETSP0802-20121206/10624_1 /TAXON_ID=38833 /ORGANISM="Micromonas sp., Strain CCMP2099" /LENGTH=83 /DNA_ID=CAMNT_0005448965 /DNA_START=544 /DNA_END=795 /DNA_ORIENTATION=-
MRSADQFQAVDFVELRGDPSSEQPPRPPRAHRPGFDILRVAPHHVAKRPLMRNLAKAVDRAYLVKGPDVGRQSAVHAQRGAVD